MSETSTAFLNGLFDFHDDAIWRRFMERFRGAIIRLARRLGLQAADAEDVCSETVVTFQRRYKQGRYDRRRGSLRNWVWTIARYHVYKRLRDLSRNPNHLGDVEPPQKTELNVLWYEAWDQEIRSRAVRTFREKSGVDELTNRIFELIIIGGRSPREVANELGIEARRVNKARDRYMKRLQGIMQELLNDF